MIKKAGCILVNKKINKIGLVFRERYKDYSFPKGHLEKNESLIECAIRETEEETKRKVIILENKEIFIEYYKDSNNCDVESHYYIGIDNGKSDNKSLEVHDLVWKSIDEVESTLTYEHSKILWNNVKEKIRNILKES